MPVWIGKEVQEVPRKGRLREKDRSGEGRARGKSAWLPVFFIYHFAFVFGFLFYSPVLLWRLFRGSAYKHGYRERMGKVCWRDDHPRIWIHGVSVGEVKAAQPLVDALSKQWPGVDVVVSSTTPTGAALARSLFGEERVFFYPLDFGPFPARALDRTKPDAVLLMELELWPNFLQAAERRGIPVAVVNGRISDKSFRGYRKLRGLLPQIDRIDLFCVQNQTYAKRLLDLGVAKSRVRVSGNIKYDSLEIHPEGVDRDRDLAVQIGLRKEERVLVCGSTHAPEERLLGRVVMRLCDALGENVRLILTPRHPERSKGVAAELRRNMGEARVERLTALRERGLVASEGTVIVIDTIGELERAYSLADLVFVGGSLVAHGGQNMLEPVALGKATLFGPHIWNFQRDVDLLIEGEGVIQVKDEEELFERLLALFRDPELASALSRRAQRVLTENQGAIRGTTREIHTLLAERSPRLAALDSERSEDLKAEL